MAVKASATISLYRIKEVTNTTNYYLLQSSTANPPAKPTTDNPGGNWSTTEPTYTEGSTNTLYTVTKTSYSDGSFEYTPVSKSTSYEASKAAYNKAVNAQSTANTANEAINNLEIGGRNYSYKTRHMTDWTSPSTAVRYVEDNFDVIKLTATGLTKDAIKSIYPINRIPITLVENKSLVLSMDVKVDDYSLWDRKLVGIIEITETNSNTRIGWHDIGNTIYNVKNQNDLENGKWTRVYVSFVPKSDFFSYSSGKTWDMVNYLTFRLTLFRNGTIHFKKVKLEFGTKPTDWTPAPEDVDDQLNDMSDDFSNQINNITIGGRNYISNLGRNWEPGHWSMTDGTAEAWNNRIRLKDPIEVTPGSTLAIKVYQNDTVVRNLGFRTYKEDDTFVGSQVDIQNQLMYTVPNSVHRIRCFIYEDSDNTSILDDGKIKIKIEFGNKYTDYTPSPEDVNDQINYQINNISFGGRNYFKESNTFTSGGSHASGITTSIENGLWKVIAESGNGNWNSWTHKNIIEENFSTGDDFVFSFDIKSDDSNTTKPPDIYFKPGMGYYRCVGSVSSEWSRCYYVGKWNDTNNINFHFGWSGLVGTYYIRKLKFERGTKPTDWTLAPEDTESSIAEVIVGTQTAATASWVGKASFNALTDKQQIAYWLPVASAANATLNLTLADGTTTGAIPLYYQGTTRLGTHYPAGSVVHLTYRENVTIGSTTIAKGWWGDANYNTNDNTYDRIRFNNNIVVKTAISADRLIVGDDSGYFHFAAGVTFNIDKPILLAKTAKAAGATDCNNNYLSIPSVNLQNNVSGFTGEENSTVYIVGILNGNNFVVDSSTPLTTTVPISDDGKYYISLGYIYRNANHSMYLYPEHPIYKYVNGQFKNLSQVAYEAQYSISNLQIGGRNLVLHSKTFEKILDGTASVTTSSKTLELSQLFTKENYAGKEITISFYAEASDLVLNDFGRHRYGVELSFPRTDGGTTYIGAWRTTHEDWSGRFYFTGTIPENWTGAIGAHHAYIQGYDVGSKIKIFKIKIESGNMMTDWTEAPEDSGSITKSPTAPADVTSVWFNTNDSMFYVYDNNSDSPTYQTWVIINDISGSFEEINRKFNQDIPNNIAQAIANNNIELANVYYTKEQVDAQLEIKDGEIRQTFNDWVTRVENTANGVNEIVTDLSGYINTGTKDGSTYLELGNRSSDFKVKIENSRMAILYKNQEVTKWEQDIFEVETVISKLLHLGKFGFIVNDDDSISFRKIDQ